MDDEIYSDNFMMKWFDYVSESLESKEYSFCYSIIYKRYYPLTEKQKNWYLSLLSKYPPEDKILPGSVASKMIKGKNLSDFTEIEQKHILTYSDVFNLNQNIITQIKIYENL
ncbi:MAG: hypothetical protein WDZ41_00155 [Candidatus Babeliales bacterium]